MKYLLTAFILLIFTLKAAAQFTDSTHYHLNVVANGSINQADGDHSYLLNNALNFAVKQKSFVLNATNTWVYGKHNSKLTNNDYSSALFFNLYKTFPHFYYWGLANYNTSYSLKINNQLLAGVGAAYNLIDGKNVTFNVSDGVLFDQSDLVTNSDYHTYRNSLRLFLHLSNDTFVFDGSSFLQSSISSGNDYIIRSSATLGVKLKKWIALTTSLAYNKMNITQSSNLIFTYGLTIDKFF